MADIIKTWPAFMDPRKVLQIFGPRIKWSQYYFTLGRGKPQKVVEGIWFTYRGRILGRIPVLEIVRNDGSLPPLNRLDGGESEWQIKHDNWVAICEPPLNRLREKVYFAGFRGWRYFNLERYRGTVDARHPV